MRAIDIQSGLRIFEGAEWQYVFAATSFGAAVQRSFRLADDGGVEMFFPEAFESRSQDLPEAFQDAGQFYWGTTRAWLDGARVFGSRSTVVRIPRWRAQDIDTPDDWDHALMLWQALRDSGVSEPLSMET
jgi:pseudaminic acid cytidylyltransferase